MLQSLCNFGPSKWLIIGENVAPLVYYSHLPIVVLSILLALFILLNNKKSLPNKILFVTLLTFALWVFLDSVFWATNRSDTIMFVWSVIILIEPLVYVGCLYLIQVLTNRQDISFQNKIILFLLYLPLIILTPTKYMLISFDISTCLALEHTMAYYSYVIEAIVLIWIISFSVKKYINAKPHEKTEIVSLTIGTILFLFSFAWGNITGSFTENWQLAQYGLFGMPIFAGFLVYSIVRFKTFNIKLLGAQALVVALWILLGAILFLRTIENVRIIVSLTLMLFLVIGIFLIRSVRREVEQREKIEKLAKDLERANEKLRELDNLKSEFLSLASHQIRAPLTAIKGYSSMLVDGDFGILPEKAKSSVSIILKSCQNLINIVEDFLNISRIEQGKIVYEKSIFEIGELVKEITNEIKPNVANAGLLLNLQIDQNTSIKVNADRNKIKQAISNIIDNSLKYTLKGNVHVSVFKEKNTAKVVVKDTGVGIDPKEIDKLFAKFSRTRDANKTNVIGTGLGLYIAKKMTEAQGGDIKVMSEGLNKGTTFTIELPEYV